MFVLAVVLALYLYSFARQNILLPRPEDMQGREGSALNELQPETKQTTKGSDELKVTGPVWIEK